ARSHRPQPVAREEQVLPRRELRHEAVGRAIGGYDSEPGVARIGGARDAPPGDRDPPAEAPEAVACEARERGDELPLSVPLDAGDGDDLPRRDGERDAVERDRAGA